MLSDKINIQVLTETLAHKGVKDVVLCPGSRNAPLSLTFYNHPAFSVKVIPDERSAAYFALGIAQQTKRPVVICCTSGTAVLNFAPALAEAYYLEIPLIAITADRPPQWIDQADGQTIRQKNVYANYINASFEVNGDENLSGNSVIETVSKAFDSSLFPKKGPVHINVPLEEPLYGRSSEKMNESIGLKIPVSEFSAPAPDQDFLKLLAEKWNAGKKKMVIAGLNEKNEKLNELLNTFSEDQSVVVFTETSSNLSGNNFLPCIDRVLSAVNDENIADFCPEILLTFGGPVISKKIKALLRKFKPAEHWLIDAAKLNTNTYQALTQPICSDAVLFFENFIPLLKKQESRYYNNWKMADNKTGELHSAFVSSAPYCDLTVFAKLLQQIPEQSILQMGNSTPVRYVQLFNDQKNLVYYSNRGTSGIDGCVSTAAGFASAEDRTVTLISGDIGFFYDSNALWNNYLTPNLRIIVINNGGGGIFRIIEHPEKEDEIQTLFETRHNRNISGMVKSFGLNYFSAESHEELDSVLPLFYQSSHCASVLEIKTPAELNAQVLKKYFEHLKQSQYVKA